MIGWKNLRKEKGKREQNDLGLIETSRRDARKEDSSGVNRNLLGPQRQGNHREFLLCRSRSTHGKAPKGRQK
jgi:hypothetical protein